VQGQSPDYRCGSSVDLPTDSASLAAMWRDGKAFAAICHGPAALFSVKNANGQPVVFGKGFLALATHK